MEIFHVFSMNGIENYPAAGEIFLENVILKVSDTLSQGFLSQGGGGGGGGGPMPPPFAYPRGALIFQGGAVKYPE